MVSCSLRKKFFLVLILLLFFSAGYFNKGLWYPAYLKMRGRKTTEQAIEMYGKTAILRMKPYFQKAKVDFPPKKVIFVALKAEKLLEVWVLKERNGILIRKYPILGASGKIGPKLKEGDLQVPEGIYKLVAFNPNSRGHLSMKLNYPNDFDLKHAQREGRKEPGSNIFVHGKAGSTGCLAMGNQAIEELFTLVYYTGKENVKLILVPYDFRKKEISYNHAKNITWLPALYEEIDRELLYLKNGSQ